MAVVLHTTCGDLPILLYYKECPKCCFNFLALCAASYYNNCAFYRHFPTILLQAGDPTNKGKGGESIFSFQTEEEKGEKVDHGDGGEAADAPRGAKKNARKRFFEDEGFGVTFHGKRGTLSMAHKGAAADTNASQFFISLNPQSSFDGVYSCFGEVLLDGYYVVTGDGVGEVRPLQAADGPPERAAVPARPRISGDEALQALEEAASGIDTKNMVIDCEKVQIISTTVLFNPFAEGLMKL
ncbi:peptidylprolyl isomerase [Strigomonas culicis]|uniref:Peptidylprolyl isomerase n=1 Tax=Strigomonas culicis TaxID=28005 RepID=S9W8Z1_9TRYP|nr:peptidylprolyl isomerase [Strigomonas culicis]|eukprot:EPY35711.1 peptidylprolyl isomerase [Strigomonas culicis]